MTTTFEQSASALSDFSNCVRVHFGYTGTDKERSRDEEREYELKQALKVCKNEQRRRLLWQELREIS